MSGLVFAHTPGRRGDGDWHGLHEHLESVAALAEERGGAFGCPQAARLAGLWHDAGKYSPDFQDYLKRCHEYDNASRSGQAAGSKPRRAIPHAPAGALAWKQCNPLAFVIAAHHAGLYSGVDLGNRLKRDWPGDGRFQQAIDAASADLGAPVVDAALISELRAKASNEHELELVIRLLLSALVDADRLDTERFWNPERADKRATYPLLDALLRAYSQYMKRFPIPPAAGAVSDVNSVRAEVLAESIAAAHRSPGVHRLTVPTGGGKTLASLGFALHHAVTHGLRRVVMAIPYTSIIDQTAAVYRDVFKELGDVVLEHHSAIGETAHGSFVGGETDSSAEAEREVRHELACENWDAPLIVTTNVQLFDSLFSNHPSACRKLHNLARSVIILDEAQTLPTEMLNPCVKMLEGLVKVAGCSIVLCTATQPALDAKTYSFAGFSPDIVRGDIVPQPERYYERLRRVEYDLRPREEAWDWDRVAQEALSAPQCLCILNTRKDALALLDALQALAAADALDGGDWADKLGVFHLSTLLCGAHRKEVLAEVKRRLEAREPCRLVSTQVVEAGVDVDFPLVLRAMGPLDSIVQAAGRCNREGKLLDKHGQARLGRVVVFHPEKGGLPRGSYRVGTANAQALLAGGNWDISLPETHREYFLRFTDSVNTDSKGIQDFRKALDYPKVAEFGHLIDKGHTEGLIVGWGDKANSLIDGLRRKVASGSSLDQRSYRALNEHTVSVFKPQLKGLDSLIDRKSLPGLAVWTGNYHPLRGIVLAALMEPDDAIA